MAAGQVLSQVEAAMDTTVAVFGNSSCSQPAQFMAITRELSCTPQANHWEPVCQLTDIGYTVQDCTRYYSRGWDDYNLIDEAFGYNSFYLVVEEYDNLVGWCGDNDALINVTLYALNEDCHVNPSGATSTKLTIGQWITVTRYDDSDCVNAVNTTEVTRDAIDSNECVDSSKRFYLRGPRLMTAVAVFEDSACSATPVALKFTRDFVCGADRDPARRVCGPDGATLYSKSSCTNAFSELTYSLFGNDTPYIIMEEFEDSWCNQAGTVSVYSVDGTCHPNTNDETSFTAILTAQGTATITNYADTYCGSTKGSVDVTKQMFTSYMCVRDQDCLEYGNDGCSRRFSVGGLGGPPAMGLMTSLTVYENSSCSQPAETMVITRELSCTPQANHWEPVCQLTDIGYTVQDCTRYYSRGWDDYNLIDEAFGYNSSYLVVEEYDNLVGWCGDNDALINITLYALNEDCHVNPSGATSTKLTIGQWITITRYDDSDCVNAVNTTEVTRDAIDSNECVDSSKRFHLRGPRLMTAVAVFEDSACSATPVALKFTRDFVCGADRDPARRVCGPDGATLYSKSSCTNAFSELTYSLFGNDTPYIIMEEFEDSWCNQAGTVSVYSVDGTCHPNTNDETSFTAILTAQGTATITNYADTYCGSTKGSVDVTKQMFTSYMCVRDQDCLEYGNDGCSRRFSVGGLGGPPAMGLMTSLTVYENSSCSQPAETMVITRELSCTPQANHWEPVCQLTDIGYTVQDCTRYYSRGWDDYNLIDEAFGYNSSYLVVEEYDNLVGWCGDNDALINITLYALNEDCHVNPSGATSTKLTIGQWITVTRYDDSDCINAVNTTEVTRDAIDSNECVDSSKRFYLRGPRLMTAVAVFEGSACSATPVALKFTRDFVCGADRDPARRVCGPDGATLYSKSSCTNAFSELTYSLFGNDTPYIIMEEFEDSWCNQAGTVSVYSVDGTCHPNTNDETSFTAILTAQGTATITNYADTYCGSTKGSVDVTKQMFTSYMCVRDQDCLEYGNDGCSRRFSVGGLGEQSDVSSSRMKVVSIYEDDSCGEKPSQLVAKSQLSCTDQGAPTCMGFDVGPFALHKDNDCTDDFAEFAAAKFGNAPYLVVEKYVDGTNCVQQDKVVAFMADSKCHFNISDGTSFQISRGAGTSIIIAKYPTSSCNDFEADYVMVGSKYINRGVCFAGNMKIYADMASLLAPPPPPVMDIDSMTREQIMFPEWLWEPVPRRVFESD